MNTRTVLLWHNNGVERIYFTVNPAEITISRPNRNREVPLAMGGSALCWGGRGLREVTLTTFLPGERSPFFNGTAPETVLSLLKSWQDSGDPVRLIISGSDINDAFLIEDVTERLQEGDGDVGVRITLKEYKFLSRTASSGGGASAAASGSVRAESRSLPERYPVRQGDTLWGIASRFYGDGRRWQTIAAANGVTDPKRLPLGKVLRL